jgi:ABC-type sulfate transport system permease subunit
MLLLPVATALLQRGRLGARGTVAAMVVPFAVALAWVLAKTTAPDGNARYPWSIEPIYAGLTSSLLLYGAGWIVNAWRRRGSLAAAPLEGERIG